MSSCFYCQGNLDFLEEVHRTTECPQCSKPVKVCLNCDFYAPGRKWDCRETIPEAVRNKDEANFCSYFRLKKGDASVGGNTSFDKAKKAKSEFEDLFS